MNTLYEGRHLRLIDDGGWEYAQRTKITGVVVILAVTDADEVVLIEQYRPPLKARVVELPAGLAGDIVGAEDEALICAATRELHEETGYDATEWTILGSSPVSAGMTDETVTFFYAKGLSKTGEGGGDESEDIVTTLVPITELRSWLAAREATGALLDSKIGGALWMAGLTCR